MHHRPISEETAFNPFKASLKNTLLGIPNSSQKSILSLSTPLAKLLSLNFFATVSTFTYANFFEGITRAQATRSPDMASQAIKDFSIVLWFYMSVSKIVGFYGSDNLFGDIKIA